MGPVNSVTNFCCLWHERRKCRRFRSFLPWPMVHCCGYSFFAIEECGYLCNQVGPPDGEFNLLQLSIMVFQVFSAYPDFWISYQCQICWNDSHRRLRPISNGAIIRRYIHTSIFDTHLADWQVNPPLVKGFAAAYWPNSAFCELFNEWTIEHSPKCTPIH